MSQFIIQENKLEKLEIKKEIDESFKQELDTYSSSIKNVSNNDNTVLDSKTGWILVVASFFNLFFVIGVIYSNGVFIKYYNDYIFKDKASLSTLTFIGTLSTSLMSLFGIFSGRIADKFGYRKTILLGTIIFSLGLLLASFSYEIWQLFITQGVIVGIGSAISFIPAISAPSQWFDKYIGLATGITVAGSGIGGLVLSPLIQLMLGSLGYQWALRILAIASFVVLFVSSFFIKERVVSVDKGQWFDFSKFKDRRFLALFFGCVVYTMGYMTPFLLMGKYAQSIGLTGAQGAILIGMLNGGSAIGRVALGILSDRFGRINSLFVCTLLTSIFAFLIWPFSFNFGVLTTFCLLYGAAAGGLISVLPVVAVELFGVQGIASILGLLYCGNGIPLLIGTPIASAILSASSSDIDNPNFIPVIMYTAVSAFLGATLYFIVKLMVNRRLFALI